MKNKKGMTLNMLVPAAITLIIIIVLITLGMKIGADVRDKLDSGTTEYEAANNSLQALSEVADWSDLIGLVIAAAVILTLVLGAIALRGGRS